MASALEDLGEMIAMAQADAVVAHSMARGELTLTATAAALRGHPDAGQPGDLPGDKSEAGEGEDQCFL